MAVRQTLRDRRGAGRAQGPAGDVPGESEGAKFWMGVLTDLQSGGVEDILIACIDNLPRNESGKSTHKISKGFAEAVEAVFPKATVQLCVVHQVRNSHSYIKWKDSKAFMKALGAVYKAPSREAPARALDKVEADWGQYPKVVESWRRNWDRLMAYFDFSKEIRRVVYCTIGTRSSRSSRSSSPTGSGWTSSRSVLGDARPLPQTPSAGLFIMEMQDL